MTSLLLIHFHRQVHAPPLGEPARALWTWAFHSPPRSLCLPLKMFLRDWDLSNVLFSYFWEVLIIIMIVHILVTQEIYLFDFFLSLQLRQQRKWFVAPVALGHE